MTSDFEIRSLNASVDEIASPLIIRERIRRHKRKLEPRQKKRKEKKYINKYIQENQLNWKNVGYNYVLYVFFFCDFCSWTENA